MAAKIHVISSADVQTYVWHLPLVAIIIIADQQVGLDTLLICVVTCLQLEQTPEDSVVHQTGLVQIIAAQDLLADVQVAILAAVAQMPYQNLAAAVLWAALAQTVL